MSARALGCRAVVLFLLSVNAYSYSVLTHEAIIDASWEQGIEPLLTRRFPQTTPEDLVKAHAYAYGGAIIADMGYYPFGSHFFTNLVHYVRGNHFVANLVAESRDVNEYAFALGAMAHYVADIEGHSAGVNHAVPKVYPKLASEYGPVVTYEDKPSAHLKVEFGFDVAQVAQRHYAPKAYHDFIGFEVSKPLLERAFLRTYGFDLHELFLSEDLALGTFRHAVSATIPNMTRVAWEEKKDELTRANPSLTRAKFIYTMSKAAYRQEWGDQYERPGAGSRLLAFFLRLIPRIGPLKALSFKPLTPEAETMVTGSFNRTMAEYRKLLEASLQHDVALPDRNLDTGAATRPGAYRMADEAFAQLVDKLASRNFSGITTDLRADILAFYSHANAPIATRRHARQWARLQRALQQLRSSAAAGATP
jgi:hypothetical protein